MRRSIGKGLLISVLFTVLAVCPVWAEENPESTVSEEYKGSMLDVSLMGGTIRDIFEELKEKMDIGYEVSEDILKEEIEIIIFKEKGLIKRLKEVFSTIGNPNYLLHYKKGKNGTYGLSDIEVRDRGTEFSHDPNSDIHTEAPVMEKVSDKAEDTEKTLSAEASADKGGLKKGQMEIAFIDGLYTIKAKHMDVNVLLDRLSSVGGEHDKIVVGGIDRKIDFEGRDTDISVLVEHIFREDNPKIYKVNKVSPEWEGEDILVKAGYIKIEKINSEEVSEQKEEKQLGDAEKKKILEMKKDPKANKSVEKEVQLGDVEKKKILELEKNQKINKSIEKEADSGYVFTSDPKNPKAFDLKAVTETTQAEEENKMTLKIKAK